MKKKNMDKNKKNPGLSALSFSGKFKKFSAFFQNHQWLLTIIFFLTVFIASSWVWYETILDVQPSQEVINEFQFKQKEINSKIERIEKTIEKVQDRRMRFNNTPQIADQRDIFDNSNRDDVINNSSKKAAKPTQKN